MNRLKTLVLCLLALLATACHNEDKDPRLDFIGDSIVARWDLAESFPSFQTANYGKSGSGITYIQSRAGYFAGQTVVVLTGTNDNLLMQGEAARQYAEDYVQAIVGLAASRTYLFSVLPREFTNDDPGVNERIRRFNQMVREISDNIPGIVYLDVYQDFIKDGKINPQLYNDGLHLSPYGYEILTQALLKEL